MSAVTDNVISDQPPAPVSERLADLEDGLLELQVLMILQVDLIEQGSEQDIRNAVGLGNGVISYLERLSGLLGKTAMHRPHGMTENWA